MMEGGPIESTHNAAYDMMKQGGGLPGSAVMTEGGPIETAHNAAYDMMKQSGGEPENNEVKLSSAVMTGGPIETADNVAYEMMKKRGGLPGSAVMMEGEPIETTHNAATVMVEGGASGNAAYEMTNQGGGELDDEFKLADRPPEGPPDASDGGEYEVPTPPPTRGPLPALPPSAEEKEKEDGVYECIPGDK